MKNIPVPPEYNHLAELDSQEISWKVTPVTLPNFNWGPPPPPQTPATPPIIPLPPLVNADVKEPAPATQLEEPQTHDALLAQIIQTTLKPIHGTDPKILQFIANYNLCKDVKQAAKESGLSAIDGRNLIQRPDIYECIQRIAAAGARKFGYDAEEVVAKVKEIIDFDPVDLYDPKTGAYYERLEDVPPETRRVIKKLHCMNVYEKDPNGVIIGISAKIIKYEFWDKLKAAEMLGQEKEVFKKKSEVQHEVGANMKETLLGRAQAADERRALMAKDVSSGN